MIATFGALVVLSLQPKAAPAFMPSVQAWTFNKFTVFEAIEKTAMAGSEYIELFPDQALAKEMAGVKLGPSMSDSDMAALAAQFAKCHVKPIAYGVTGIPQEEAQARKLFAWAKKVGIQILNTESTGSMDTIEKMVKEFDMKVGFHNHPKNGNANYKVWDPAYVYSIVKDRDIRIGSCADTGHWVRSGIKPVDAIRTLKGRIVSSHLKDLHEFTRNGHDVPFGLGVSDIQAILKEYTRTGFKGSVSVEYEYNWDNSVPDVSQCIGFIRGFIKSNS